jgi:hypothetical protein
MSENAESPRPHESLRPVVQKLLGELTAGAGDKDKRRQVEEWLRNLADKFPDFQIPAGLRQYYVAEAARLRADFEKATDLTERLALARSIEGFLDKAAEIDRKQNDK